MDQALLVTAFTSVAKHPDDFGTGNLDQVTATKGSYQARYLVHQRAQVGCLDLPLLGQLADQERVGVDEKAVAQWVLVCCMLLDFVQLVVPKVKDLWYNQCSTICFCLLLQSSREAVDLAIRSERFKETPHEL